MHLSETPKSRLRGAFLSQLNKLKEESLLGYILAIFPRVLFLVHAIYAIRFLKNLTQVDVDEDTWTTRSLYVGLFLLLIESFYTILARRGHENKHIWFSGFLYLTSLVPTIWLMEINFLERRQAEENDILKNMTDGSNTASTTSDSLQYLKCINNSQACSVQFVKNYTQLGLIAVIIIGRWMLPRGDLTRDQLSSLLIGYINIAADLTEFIGFHSKLNGMKLSEKVAVTVLSVYSVSLLQFIIVTTSTTYEYTEQERTTIERLTTTGSDRNLPIYLRAHSRKLRRSSIARNIDKIAMNSFAAGKRSGQRRTTMINAPAGVYGAAGKRTKNARPRNSVSIINNTKHANERVDSRLKINLITSKNESQKLTEEDNAEGTSRNKTNSQALNKWTSTAKVSQRLQRFQKSAAEENWGELSDAIIEMKDSLKKQNDEKLTNQTINDPLARLGGPLNPIDEEPKKWNWKDFIELAQSDTGAILIAMLFQECPFLVTRIAFMYQFNVLNRGLIFYTVKNLFMLTFLSYKLWVSAIQ